MRKLKRIYWISAIIIGMAFILFLTLFMMELNEDYVSFEVSDQEAQDIQSFYDNDTGNIVSGEHFDFKYVYFDADAFKNDSVLLDHAVVIDVVLKNERALTLRAFSFLNVQKYYSEDSIIRTAGENRDEFIVPLQSGYQRLGKLKDVLAGLLLFNVEINPDHDFHYLADLNMTVSLKDGRYQLFNKKEIYPLHYDEDKRLIETRNAKNKCMNEETCTSYEKREVGYYFAILFRRDFDQWYEEIKEFMESVESLDDYTMDIAFTTPCHSKSLDSLQEIMHLNDDQYQKCLEIMNILNYRCAFLNDK